MVLGRCSRFLQAFRVNEIRPTKRSTDEGSSIIAVQFRERCCKYFMFPTNFGIFFFLRLYIQKVQESQETPFQTRLEDRLVFRIVVD